MIECFVSMCDAYVKRRIFSQDFNLRFKHPHAFKTVLKENCSVERLILKYRSQRSCIASFELQKRRVLDPAIYFDHVMIFIPIKDNPQTWGHLKPWGQALA